MCFFGAQWPWKFESSAFPSGHWTARQRQMRTAQWFSMSAQLALSCFFLTWSEPIVVLCVAVVFSNDACTFQRALHNQTASPRRICWPNLSGLWISSKRSWYTRRRIRRASCSASMRRSQRKRPGLRRRCSLAMGHGETSGRRNVVLYQWCLTFVAVIHVKTPWILENTREY